MVSLFCLAYAISRVLFVTCATPLSFIYDDNHLPPPATYPPTLDEQPLVVGIHGLATHETYGPRSIATLAVGSYPAFSPLPLARRLFSSTLLYPHEYQAVNLRGALRCSDFPPPHMVAAIEHICRHKGNKKVLDDDIISILLYIFVGKCNQIRNR